MARTLHSLTLHTLVKFFSEKNQCRIIHKKQSFSEKVVKLEKEENPGLNIQKSDRA